MMSDVRKYLSTYWIELDLSEYSPDDPQQGYGVTAFDYADALQLLQERVFRGSPLPKIISLIEDVSLADVGIDPAQATKVERRGVWFPQHR